MRQQNTNICQGYGLETQKVCHDSDEAAILQEILLWK